MERESKEIAADMRNLMVKPMHCGEDILLGELVVDEQRSEKRKRKRRRRKQQQRQQTPHQQEQQQQHQQHYHQQQQLHQLHREQQQQQKQNQQQRSQLRTARVGGRGSLDETRVVGRDSLDDTHYGKENGTGDYFVAGEHRTYVSSVDTIVTLSDDVSLPEEISIPEDVFEVSMPGELEVCEDAKVSEGKERDEYVEQIEQIIRDDELSSQCSSGKNIQDQLIMNENLEKDDDIYRKEEQQSRKQTNRKQQPIQHRQQPIQQQRRKQLQLQHQQQQRQQQQQQHSPKQQQQQSQKQKQKPTDFCSTEENQHPHQERNHDERSCLIEHNLESKKQKEKENNLESTADTHQKHDCKKEEKKRQKKRPGRPKKLFDLREDDMYLPSLSKDAATDTAVQRAMAMENVDMGPVRGFLPDINDESLSPLQIRSSMSSERLNKVSSTSNMDRKTFSLPDINVQQF